MPNTKNFAIWLLALLTFPAMAGAQSFGFIENKGQVRDQNGQPRPDVNYILPLPGMNVQLRQGGFSYDTYVVEPAADPSASRSSAKAHPTRKFHRVDIALVGANLNAAQVAEHPQDAVQHHYLPDGQGIHQVQQFQKVTYQGIYPHIDLEFVAGNTPEKPVEYNFVLHPGAKLRDIQLAYHGAEKAELQGEEVTLQLAYGVLRERIPKSYYEKSGEEVKITYAQIEQIGDAYQVGFVGEMDEIQEKLIIDPAPLLEWASYYGGAADDEMQAVATDSLGNVIAVGITESANAIATSGAYQNSLAGFPNALITKMDSNGIRQWATYYGSNATEANALAVDAQGKILVAGITTSTSGMATPGAWQTMSAGAEDAFVVRFSASGLREWATWFGAAGADVATGIAVDPAGNVFVSGNTQSATGLSTMGSHQPVKDSLQDAFLAKFSPAGQVLWATYYGGPGSEYCESMALAPNGDILFAGNTSSPSRIATSGAHQVAYNGNEDGFLVRFSTSGSRIFGTFYGDNGTDGIAAIATDASGNAFVTGYTSSATAIATPGSWQPTISPGGTDALLAKFTPTGQRLWGTYFGGLGIDVAKAIESDAAGQVHFGGFTSTTNGLATSGAFQSILAGSQDGFVAQFDAAGNRLWSTYLGGPDNDEVTGIARNPQGHLFVVGTTSSTSGLATIGAHQTVPGGNVDGLLVRIGNCETPTGVQLAFNPDPVCLGDMATLTVSGNLGQATQWQWYADSCGGAPVGTGTSIVRTADSAVTYFVRGEGGCVVDLTCDSIAVVPYVGNTSVTTSPGSLLANAAFVSYQWIDCQGQAIPGATAQVFTPAVSGSYAVIVTFIGCSDTSACYAVVNVGIAEPQIELQVFPNPSHGKFTLQGSLPAGPAEIAVYGLMGQLLETRRVNGGNLREDFDLSGHAAGMYQIRLRTGNSVKVYGVIRACP